MCVLCIDSLSFREFIMNIARCFPFAVLISILMAAQVSASPPDSLWMRTYGGSTGEQIREASGRIVLAR